MSQGPNPLSVTWSVLRSLTTVKSPGPFGTASADHGPLAGILDQLTSSGMAALALLGDELADYLEEVTTHKPNQLTRAEALAFWINLYSAGALLLAGQAQERGESSVLSVPGGFRSKMVTVDGEHLSLDDIEHGKLRRFRDPRIHAALVCGSVSCPTLRAEPYAGERLDSQLDSQLRHFIGAGAIEADPSRRVVRLSRVFLWFGGDFVRPHRMPTFLPASRRAILSALVLG